MISLNQMNLFHHNKDFDFVAVGDITTDAFIRVKEAEVIHDDLRDKDKLVLAFGDKIPYEFVEVVKAVGNSANAAVAAGGGGPGPGRPPLIRGGAKKQK